jgi:hypothetical protein
MNVAKTKGLLMVALFVSTAAGCSAAPDTYGASNDAVTAEATKPQIDQASAFCHDSKTPPDAPDAVSLRVDDRFHVRHEVWPNPSELIRGEGDVVFVESDGATYTKFGLDDSDDFTLYFEGETLVRTGADRLHQDVTCQTGASSVTKAGFDAIVAAFNALESRDFATCEFEGDSRLHHFTVRPGLGPHTALIAGVEDTAYFIARQALTDAVGTTFVGYNPGESGAAGTAGEFLGYVKMPRHFPVAALSATADNLSATWDGHNGLPKTHCTFSGVDYAKSLLIR